MFFRGDEFDVKSLIQLRDCVQKCKVVADILSWILEPNDERQQEQESSKKHLRVVCTSERSPRNYKTKHLKVRHTTDQTSSVS